MTFLVSLWSWLEGKKTYIAAAASILTAVANVLNNGDWASAWKTIEPALLAATIRHGIK